MSVDVLKLLADFGLVVLIWLVQLVIYPGFLYFRAENLATWHKKYTSLISYIVGPLMLVQLMLAIYLLITLPTFFNAAGLLMILAIWSTTFLHFVPMHEAVADGELNENLLNDLVHKNWLRTILWTFVFLSSAIQYVL